VVEPSAVNRLVVGSNPTRGANEIKDLLRFRRNTSVPHLHQRLASASAKRPWRCPAKSQMVRALARKTQQSPDFATREEAVIRLNLGPRQIRPIVDVRITAGSITRMAPHPVLDMVHAVHVEGIEPHQLRHDGALLFRRIERDAPAHCLCPGLVLGKYRQAAVAKAIIGLAPAYQHAEPQ
jgi:hypothetical protein